MKKIPPTLAAARTALHQLADPDQAAGSRRFFKNPQADVFLGIPTRLLRQVAKEFRDLPRAALRELKGSGVHEERSLAHAILVLQYGKADAAGKERIFQFYLKHRGCIRSWDGVDDSAPYIVGPHLLNRDKGILYELIVSPSVWDRRIALVATWPMIRQGHIQHTFQLVARVLADKEDLIHKAAGWMLRETGKKDPTALKQFLQTHYARLPRTTLRYAIERFSEAERGRYLQGKF